LFLVTDKPTATSIDDSIATIKYAIVIFSPSKFYKAKNRASWWWLTRATTGLAALFRGLLQRPAGSALSPRLVAIKAILARLDQKPQAKTS
jgi:hypothetical protein